MYTEFVRRQIPNASSKMILLGKIRARLRHWMAMGYISISSLQIQLKPEAMKNYHYPDSLAAKKLQISCLGLSWHVSVRAQSCCYTANKAAKKKPTTKKQNIIFSGMTLVGQKLSPTGLLCCPPWVVRSHQLFLHCGTLLSSSAWPRRSYKS